jgi:hypothetical protein
LIKLSISIHRILLWIRRFNESSYPNKNIFGYYKLRAAKPSKRESIK